MIHTITHMVTALLVGALPLLAHAQRPLPLVPAPDSPALEARPPAPSGFFIGATIRRVDHRTGIVDLESEGETFSAIVSSHDLKQLHQGDIVAVYVVDDAPPTLRT
jgi:hypothetical protein